MAILSTGFHLRELAAAAVALFALSVIYKRTRLYLQRREFKKQHGCQPITRKRPMRDPLGILNMMRGARAMKEHKLLDLLLELYETVGTTFAFRFVDKYIIATHDPENIKTVLSLKFNDYGIGKREETFGELLGKGIFTTDGELWAHSRAMIRPNFTRDQVADLAAFERHVQALFKVIPEGATIDLQDLFFLFTIDSATEFLLGRSTNTLEARLTKEGAKEEQFAIAFNKAQHYIANRDRLSFLRYIIRDRESEAAVRQCHEFVDQYVEEAVAYRQKLEKSGLDTQSEDKYTFLYELAKATTDKKRLRDEILNVLLAGRDTTASLLSNMWFMIARHPEIYKKLKREVDETLNGDEPSYTQLRNMKYLKYCMNECKSLPLLTSHIPHYTCLLQPSPSHNLSTSSNTPSPPSPPRRPRQRPLRPTRHRPAPRRRTRRPLPYLRPQKHHHLLRSLRPTPSHRLLRRRRARLPSRAMG